MVTLSPSTSATRTIRAHHCRLHHCLWPLEHTTVELHLVGKAISNISSATTAWALHCRVPSSRSRHHWLCRCLWPLKKAALWLPQACHTIINCVNIPLLKLMLVGLTRVGYAIIDYVVVFGHSSTQSLGSLEQVMPSSTTLTSSTTWTCNHRAPLSRSCHHRLCHQL